MSRLMSMPLILCLERYRVPEKVSLMSSTISFSTTRNLVPSTLTCSNAELLPDGLLDRHYLIFIVAATGSWLGIIRLIRLLAGIESYARGISWPWLEK